VISINNVNNVTIQNLCIEGGNRHNIDFQNSSGLTDNITIKQNNIYHAGSAGIGSNRGQNAGTNSSQIDNVLIQANEFWQCMNWGTYTRGWGNNIDHLSNYAHSIGMQDGHNTWAQPQGNIVFMTNRGAGQDFIGNYLDTIGYTGIKFGTENGAQVLYNFVRHYCLRFTDGGGIYGGYTTSLTSMSTGRNLKGNIVLKGGSAAGAASGFSNAGNITSGHAVAYYWDANATGMNIDSCYGAYGEIGMQWNSTQNISLTNSVLFDFKSINLIQDFGATGREFSGINIQHNHFIARKRVDNINQLTFNFDGNTGAVPWNSIGTINFNVHARPTTDHLNTAQSVATSGQLISVQETTVAAVRYTLNQFAASTSYPYEHNGSNSPLHYPGANLDTLHKFYYNTGDDDTTITLDEEYIDMNSNVYRNSITLRPHFAIFLLATNAPIAPGNVAPTANAGNDKEVTLPYPNVTTATINPTADAYTRDGSYATTNFGTGDLALKTSTAAGFTRRSYLKFNVGALADLDGAKLRLYGSNTEDGTAANASVFAVATDTWTETGITWNNQPAAGTELGALQFDGTAAYKEIDISSFALQEYTGDGTLSIAIIQQPGIARHTPINSRENASNKPELVVDQISYVRLTGSNSFDTDGSLTYLWTKQAGSPAGGTVSNPTSPDIDITTLQEGTYVYRLTVTDDDGATDFDEVSVIVSPSLTPNVAPTAIAGAGSQGADQTITLPTNSVTLISTGSTDTDGSIASYQWTKISGGAATIVSPTAASTVVAGLVAGNYVFRLRVTDAGSPALFDEDEVTVTVLPTVSTTPAKKGTRIGTKGQRIGGKMINIP
jgi:hypothetical protein